MGIEPSAREHLVVAIKGTFAFPARDGEPCVLAEEQAPLVMADEFFGAPGYSSPRYEVDFALTKPRCDVLLNATAHAPGRPALAARAGRGQDRRLVQGLRRRGRAGLAAARRHPRPVRARALRHQADHLRTCLRRRRQPRPERRPARQLHSQPGRPGLAPGPQPEPDPGHALARDRAPGRSGARALGRLPAHGFRRARAQLGAALPLRRHLRSGLDRQRLPVPAGGLRRALLPGRPRGPADRPPQGRRGGHPRQPHARGPHPLPPAPARGAGRLLPQARRPMSGHRHAWTRS